MKKEARLNEIQKLWKRRDRIEPWENLKWETNVSDAQDVDPKIVRDVEMSLKYNGHMIGILDGSEIEVAETPWDEYLLKWLRVWYYLGEDSDAPLFVNETANAIAIASYNPERFDLLFYHPHAEVLGLEHWEKRVRESNAQIHEWQRDGRRKRFETKNDSDTPPFLAPTNSDAI